jgi:toxin YoeB
LPAETEPPPGASAPSARRDEVYDPAFREDLRWWVQTDRRMALRVFTLIESVMRDPFAGLGKPEPLKRLGPNTWSRRINEEHRLVYVVGHDRITFVQARYHY